MGLPTSAAGSHSCAAPVRGAGSCACVPPPRYTHRLAGAGACETAFRSNPAPVEGPAEPYRNWPFLTSCRMGVNGSSAAISYLMLLLRGASRVLQRGPSASRVSSRPERCSVRFLCGRRTRVGSRSRSGRWESARAIGGTGRVRRATVKADARPCSRHPLRLFRRLLAG